VCGKQRWGWCLFPQQQDGWLETVQADKRTSGQDRRRWNEHRRRHRSAALISHGFAPRKEVRTVSHAGGVCRLVLCLVQSVAVLPFKSPFHPSEAPSVPCRQQSTIVLNGTVGEESTQGPTLPSRPRVMPFVNPRAERWERHNVRCVWG
jgi:hypothetical protein